MIGSSSVPDGSIMARVPKRSARRPNSGVANALRAKTPGIHIACLLQREALRRAAGVLDRITLTERKRRTDAYQDTKNTCRPRMVPRRTGSKPDPPPVDCPDSTGA